MLQQQDRLFTAEDVRVHAEMLSAFSVAYESAGWPRVSAAPLLASGALREHLQAQADADP